MVQNNWSKMVLQHLLQHFLVLLEGLPDGSGHQPRRPRSHHHGAQRHGPAARAALGFGGAQHAGGRRDDDRVPWDRRNVCWKLFVGKKHMFDALFGEMNFMIECCFLSYNVVFEVQNVSSGDVGDQSGFGMGLLRPNLGLLVKIDNVYP